MYNKKKILAIIPARGGSKGLSNKNILELSGKPLIAWTIEAAQNSRIFDKIIVSTDSIEIANISKAFNAEVPFLRPSELSSDQASTDDVILHTLTWLKENDNFIPDIFILLQPTSPLRNSVHIKEALAKFLSSTAADLLYSVNLSEKTPYWMKITDENGFLRDLIDGREIKRRQDAPKVYSLNGAIYIMNVDSFYKCNKLNSNNAVPYIMGKSSSIDIDDHMDFQLAAYILEKNNQEYNEPQDNSKT